jgi:hypothetical protein
MHPANLMWRYKKEKATGHPAAFPFGIYGI